MSKHWDKEPTILTDAAEANAIYNRPELAVVIDHARNLERRMRAAERLIKIGGKWDGGYDWERWKRECNEHIEAAFKEDGR